MVKENEGGMVIGKKKIFCLKFENDAVTFSDMPKRLQNMIRDLDKFCKESGIEVNGEKIKIMVFMKRGKGKG